MTDQELAIAYTAMAQALENSDREKLLASLSLNLIAQSDDLKNCLDAIELARSLNPR